jgi:hypothetical protein
MNLRARARTHAPTRITCLLSVVLAVKLVGCDSAEVATAPGGVEPRVAAVPPVPHRGVSIPPTVVASNAVEVPSFLKWLEEHNRTGTKPSAMAEKPTVATLAASPADPLRLRLEEAVDGFHQSNDPKWYILLEGIFEEVRTARRSHSERAEPLLSTAYEAVSLGVGTSDAQFQAHMSKLRKWSEAHPDSPVPLIAAANTFNSWAWFARGSGFAPAVEEDAWAPFRDRLVKARALLDKAEKLQPVDPQLYVVSLRVGRVDCSERAAFDSWLEKGQALDSQCLPLFREMAVSLLPRWHGEPGEVEQLAKRLQAEIPGQDGWNAYAAVAIQHAWFEPAGLIFDGYDRKDLHEAARSVADRWPLSSQMNQFAGFIALLAQDVELARQTQPAIGDEFKSPWWYTSKIEAFKKFCGRGKPWQSGDWDLWDLAAASGVRFLKDGDQLASITADAESLKLWEIESERPTTVLPLEFEKVHSFDRHPSRNEVAIGATVAGVNSAVIIDLEGMKEPKLLYEAGLGPFGVSYAGDGQTLVAAHEDILTIWDVPQAKLVERLSKRVFRRVASSPDGNQIIARNGSFYDRRAKKWQSTYETAPPSTFVITGGFLANDTIFGSAMTSNCEIIQSWNPKTHKHAFLLQSTFESQAYYFALSSDRNLLAVCQTDGSGESLVGVLDLQANQVRTVYYPLGMIHDMAFAPDGGRLALACDDGCTRVFLVPPVESRR